MSKWDVQSVKNMDDMFMRSRAFNGDISKWDVSKVLVMDNMFMKANAFKQAICGAAWIQSKASKIGMFERSFGSISRTECTEAPESATKQAIGNRASPRPKKDRQLIIRTVTAGTKITCPKCGTFQKSGRV